LLRRFAKGDFQDYGETAASGAGEVKALMFAV
jgi:hypothetical protein